MNQPSSPDPSSRLEGEHSQPVPTIEEKQSPSSDAPVADLDGSSVARPTTNGADGGADSEAETEIESPVKKREADRKRQQEQSGNTSATAVKSEKGQKSRIGSLPVPHDDDEDAESAASALDSTEIGASKAALSSGDAKTDVDADMMDAEGSEHESDELSSPQSEDDASPIPSRATSERPQQGPNGSTGSPNPRKRKHRASSVSLPSSKRQSMDPPKRTRLRGMHSEDIGGAERSPSPRALSHRRTVSTQSALDGTGEGNRKRRSIATIPTRESKTARTMEESDASSETTSRGLEERQRPQRGSGRWSSATPGRPPAREAKRWVNKYGFTHLAEACEHGNLDAVKEWRETDPDQLELAEFAGNKPLQIAALNGNSEIVSYLIEQGCQIDCANVDKDTPLIDAAENGHLEVVKLLLAAGVDPLRQNMKGQQALDVVTDDTDDAGPIRAALHSAIDAWNSSEAKQRRDEEEENRHRFGPSKELHFMARTYENLIKLVQNNDRNGVREFLAARVPVDNAVIAAAARTGDLYLVNMLLAEMTEKKASQKPEKPMLSVLGSSHFEMVQSLTELEYFNPLWKNRAGKSWPEIAEERQGPMWRQEKELLTRLHEQHKSGNKVVKERRSSSPVAKRDRVKRRLAERAAQQKDVDARQEDSSSEDMEEDERGGRKNGRRLMTRRDMRAVTNRGAISESESDDGGEEDADGEVDDDAPSTVAEEEAMKPPDTPTRRRLRSKSISSPANDVSTKGKTLRRRSSSLRGAQDLPTLTEEKNESSKSPGSSAKADKEREAKFRLEEAQRLADKQKEADAAAEEARRVEEANAKKAEEERLAKEREEQRLADEKRAQEEAEEKRREEEERARKEKEAEEARLAYEAEVLEALPSPLARLLDSTIDLCSSSEMESLKGAMLPLHALPRTRPSTPAGAGFEKEQWLLNFQAAPFLSDKKSGLQLFFRSDKPGYETSTASQCTTDPLIPSDWSIVDEILARLLAASIPTDHQDGSTNGRTLDSEFAKAATRMTSFISAGQELRRPDSAVALRRVRLSDVQARSQDRLDFNWSASPPLAEQSDKLGLSRDGEDFVSHLRGCWETIGKDSGWAKGCVRMNDVAIVHEK